MNFYFIFALSSILIFKIESSVGFNKDSLVSTVYNWPTSNLIRSNTLLDINEFDTSDSFNITARSGAATSSHVLPPSPYLKHFYESYKPKEFRFFLPEIDKTNILIGFYLNDTSYKSYIFRIRTFGDVEYATNKVECNLTSFENFLLLKKFWNGNYVVCVTLYRDFIEAASTSDMCFDLTVTNGVNQAHAGNTGLLGPLILAVCASFLAFIAVVTCFKECYKKHKQINSLSDKVKLALAGDNINATIEINKEINKDYLNKLFNDVDRSTLSEFHVINRSKDKDEIIQDNINRAYESDEDTPVEKNSHLLNNKPWDTNGGTQPKA